TRAWVPGPRPARRRRCGPPAGGWTGHPGSAAGQWLWRTAAVHRRRAAARPLPARNPSVGTPPRRPDCPTTGRRSRALAPGCRTSRAGRPPPEGESPRRAGCSCLGCSRQGLLLAPAPMAWEWLASFSDCPHGLAHLVVAVAQVGQLQPRPLGPLLDNGQVLRRAHAGVAEETICTC